MKKIKPYLLTLGILVGILGSIFLIKGIYPFGNNSLIWTDMHDQITAFYYHFYDSFRGNASLLIDFTTSSGINFYGILAYYILSPFSFLVLLVARNDIYLMVSIIVALKILLCGITFQYFIRKYFKNIKLPFEVLFSVIYALSSYALIMYPITPWIDAMYLFPILMIGLKKVLDNEKPTLYITILSLSLIMSFYVTIMSLIFVFLGSFIYVLVYNDTKDKRKKAICSLGISTVLSLGIAAVVIVPAYLQISISSRAMFNLKSLLNSKLGTITDKLNMFNFGGIIYTGILLLFYNSKDHKKFLSFYIPTLLLLLIPVLIEPINRIWHFGSYACFAYRFGYITVFMLILGACCFFNNYKEYPKFEFKNKKTISIFITIFAVILTCVLANYFYFDYQDAISELSLASNHLLLFAAITITLILSISTFAVLVLNKKLNKFTIVLIYILSLTHIFTNSMLYLGIDNEQDTLMGQYVELNKLKDTYQDGNYYRVKNQVENMIMNSGMVMKYHTLDHFTSLTDASNLKTLKTIGYSSYWVKTYSRGGNLFTDAVLANKYIISDKKIDNKYYKFIDKYDDIYLYELKFTPSYGYLISNNDTFTDKENAFVMANNLYRNITGTNQDIFEVYNRFDFNNVKTNLQGFGTLYDIVDPTEYSYIEKTIDVKGEKTLYLEMLRSLNNTKNYEMYEKFNIYVNGKLLMAEGPFETNNGLIELGMFNNETVNIKIELLKKVDLARLYIGAMDNKKYEDFMNNYNLNTKIDFDKNKINVTVDSIEDKILLLPINYNTEYSATNNGDSVEVLKVYDNYIGIKLNKGINNIELTFVPKGLKLSALVSLVSLVVTVLLLVTNFYKKITNNDKISGFIYLIYRVLYYGAILVIYVGLTLCFIISMFIKF